MDNFSFIKQLEDRGCKVKYKKNKYGVYRVRYKCPKKINRVRKLTSKSYVRGHLIGWDEKKREWYYVDNGSIFDDSRACKKCGKFPTKEGYDACIGYIPGMESVCCGHGISNPIMESE
jgi:hypothetical protein